MKKMNLLTKKTAFTQRGKEQREELTPTASCSSLLSPFSFFLTPYSLLLLLLVLIVVGCQGVALTGLVLLKGTEVPPKFDMLLKGEKRVAVVPRSVYSNAYELQNAPREMARQVSGLLEENIRHAARLNHKNTKLHVIDQSKVEAWLDQCNNDFDSFSEVGRDKSIKADIIIGIEVVGFQIRDPRNASLIQGRCHVQVQAIDCATGKIQASETLMIVDPPNMPLANNPQLEPQFRRQFIHVVSKNIAALFHYHDKNMMDRMDADNLEMHRIN